MGKCKFNSGWLSKLDINGRSINTWARKFDDYSIYCVVCEKKVVIKLGFAKLNQHAATQSHKKLVHTKLSNLQLKLSGGSGGNFEGTNSGERQEETVAGVVQLFSSRDAANRLELLWTLKIVASNWSFNSCSDLSSFLKCTMAGSIPEGFSLSVTKLRYLINYAVGPFFKKKLLEDIGSNYYTLLYDETTNSANAKELNVSIRFFSKIAGRVVTSHLETHFIGHATADILSESIIKTVNNCGLSFHKLIMISSDGPFVNKKVWKLINEHVKQIRNKSLLDIGTCNIHIMHNAFLKGLESFGVECSDFAISIYYFFKGWPSREDDYKKLQLAVGVPSHTFLKHASTRWLTLETAVSRILEQWPAIRKYFLDYLPKHGSKNILQNKNYKNIKSFLMKSTAEAEMQFVKESSKIFLKFTCFFQKDEPLIHLMYDKIKEILVELIERICSDETLINFDKLVDTQKLFQQSNLLKTEKVNPGKQVLDALSNIKNLNEREKLEFLSNVRQFFVSSASHILNKIPLFSTKIKYISFFNPFKMQNTKRYDTEKYLTKVLQILPVNDEDHDLILHEFKKLKRDVAFTEFQNESIDTYWNRILNLKNEEGNLEYKNIASVVLMQCCTLAHGNASVERNFSQSGRILREDRASMKVGTLNSVLCIQDYLKNQYSNKPELVLITKELIGMARVAYKSYETYMQMEKDKKDKFLKDKEREEKEKQSLTDTMKEMETEKKNLEVFEKKLKIFTDEKKEKQQLTDVLLKEAHKKIKSAVKSKNIIDVSVAQTMLESVQSARLSEERIEKEVVQLHKNLIKRKSNTLDRFIIKNKKTKSNTETD